MTTPKNLHRLKAMMFLAGAIVAPFRLIHPSKGSQGAFTEAAIVGMTLLGFAAYYWFKFKQTSDKAVFYDITKQSPTKQIKISKACHLDAGGLGNSFELLDLSKSCLGRGWKSRDWGYLGTASNAL